MSRAPATRELSWASLRQATPARIGIGRAGAGLPTAAHLEFQRAHALARDAVHASFDAAVIMAGIAALGLEPVALRSTAGDRATYLRRPDLGRRLDGESHTRLEHHRATRPEIAFIVADGLSATAVNRHAVPLLGAVLERCRAARPRLGPVAVVEGGRVAIGDAIGGALGAELAAVLIGERPGLSAPDSLGGYVTWQPAPGTLDAARNCLSNIRPGGMPIPDAADALVRLIAAARRWRLTGVPLSRRMALEGPQAP